MIVVFDTNIFVSAFGFPGGRAQDAVDRIVSGRDQLVLSQAIMAELADVMARKLRRQPGEIFRALVYFDSLGAMVVPKRRLNVVRDGPDNRILECAVSAGAEAIVTGDKAMLALKTYAGIRIMSLAQYLASD